MASAAVVRVGVGRVRVAVRAPAVRVVRPAYVAPVRRAYVAPVRPAARAVIHHRRAVWHAIH